MREAVLTAEELGRRLAAEFPETFHRDTGLAILGIWHGGWMPAELEPFALQFGSAPARLADITDRLAVGVDLQGAVSRG
jgi:hypothetical protein